MHASLGEQLREALNKWDNEEKEQAAQQAQPALGTYQKTSPFQVTNNLNRTAFDEIKNYPDTRKNITQRLLNKGYKLGSVSAVLGHMLRQGVAQLDDEGVMHVTTPEYVPLKSHKTLKNLKKKAPQKKVTQIVVDVRNRKLEEKRPVSSSSGKAGIAALSPAPTPAPTPAPMPPKPWSVYGLLETLSILQARDLYDELKKIFEVTK